MLKESPHAKLDQKTQDLLSMELGDPRKRLFTVFLLIGVIPVLALVYVLHSNQIFHGQTLTETGPVLFFAGLIMTLGSAVGYGIVQKILLQVLAYATQAKRADETKSSFAMALAHDLKSPLLVIKANISNLKAGFLGTLSAKQEEALTVCKDVADRMNALIMGLVEAYKIEARIAEPSKDRFDLLDTLREQIRECQAIAAFKKISLIEESGSLELPFLGDRNMILRALHNLLSNAIKFTPGGGKITNKAYAEGGFGIIECRNTGPAIPADKLCRIFDKFERLGATEEGHGLGLAITKDIVEIHGGSIWAKSGTLETNCFTILLPLREKKNILGDKLYE